MKQSWFQVSHSGDYMVGFWNSYPRIGPELPELFIENRRFDREIIVNRLHIVGGKNHGKTSLVVELVKEFRQRGIAVGTIKHTHHRHELDVPGKDSHRHRTAGATAVGILSPSMCAVFLPTDAKDSEVRDRYSFLASVFTDCRLVLVEGDSQTKAPKIEVWRSELGTPPLASRDGSILAIVSDDVPPIETKKFRRSETARLADWILSDIA
jgi:molybdopterin-guanine dinucleotide biosynthesis protein MobB